MRRRVPLLGWSLLIAISSIAQGQVATMLRRMEEGFARQIELRAARPLPPVGGAAMQAVQFRRSSFASHFIHVCGGFLSLTRQPGIEEFENPVAPVDLLWRGYSVATGMEVCCLQPLVDVSAYPRGYFGNWVREGFLVTAKQEVSGSDELRAIFLTLSDAIEELGAQDLFESPLEPGETAESYLANHLLHGDFCFEFRGETPTTLLIDFENGLVVLKQDGKTGLYTLRENADVGIREIVERMMY